MHVPKVCGRYLIQNPPYAGAKLVLAAMFRSHVASSSIIGRAYGVDDATTMFGYLGIDQFRTVHAKCFKLAGFIDAHQTRISHDVGGDDYCKSALSALRHDGSLADVMAIRNRPNCSTLGRRQ